MINNFYAFRTLGKQCPVFVPIVFNSLPFTKTIPMPPSTKQTKKHLWTTRRQIPSTHVSKTWQLRSHAESWKANPLADRASITLNYSLGVKPYISYTDMIIDFTIVLRPHSQTLQKPKNSYSKLITHGSCYDGHVVGSRSRNLDMIGSVVGRPSRSAAASSYARTRLHLCEAGTKSFAVLA